MLAVWYMSVKAPTEVQQVGEMPDHEPGRGGHRPGVGRRLSPSSPYPCLTGHPHLVPGLDPAIASETQTGCRDRAK
jgi:hypothetical protein